MYCTVVCPHTPGIPKGAFGFCHQRDALSESEIGNFTKFQARLQNNDSSVDGAKTIKKLAACRGTFTRRHFHEDGEVVSAEYLRFMIAERHLVDFRIRHFIW